MANRSSSLDSVNENEKDRFGFRKDLSKFYVRQKLSTGFFTLMTFIMIFQVYLKTRYINSFDIFMTVGLLLLALRCVWYIHKDEEKAKDYGKSQIQNWRDYCKNRKECDARFLRKVLGDDLGKKTQKN